MTNTRGGTTGLTGSHLGVMGFRRKKKEISRYLNREGRGEKGEREGTDISFPPGDQGFWKRKKKIVPRFRQERKKGGKRRAACLFVKGKRKTVTLTSPGRLCGLYIIIGAWREGREIFKSDGPGPGGDVEGDLFNDPEYTSLREGKRKKEEHHTPKLAVREKGKGGRERNRPSIWGARGEERPYVFRSHLRIGEKEEKVGLNSEREGEGYQRNFNLAG